MKSSTEVQRYTRTQPCPICSGFEQAERGQGKRCHGYTVVKDGVEWANCAQDDGGGKVPVNGTLYGHILNKPCPCGQTHTAQSTTANPGKNKNGNNKDRIPDREPDFAWWYFNARGEKQFQVIRWDEPTGKVIIQRRKARPGEYSKDGWIRNIDGAERVLYRLPELIAADPTLPVYIPEGEKAADAILQAAEREGVKLLVTTNPMGADSWKAEYSPYLKGRTVYVCPDNDKAGARHAEQIIKSVSPFAAKVYRVELPDLPPKGDAYDWLAAGNRVSDLVQHAKPCQPPSAGSEQYENSEAGAARQKPQGITAKELAAMEFPPLEFIVDDILPVGSTLLAAKPKSGKSWLALATVIAVAAGGVVLDRRVKKAEAVYLALEDNFRRLKRRLMKLCPNGVPDGLTFFTQWARSDQGGLEDLDEWLAENPNVKLVVIDTLQKWRKPLVGNTSIYNADYEALDGLTKLAAKYNIAIVVVHHTRKGESEDPLEEVSGSFGLTGAVDNILVIRRERGRPGAEMSRIGRDLEDDTPLALEFDLATAQWSEKPQEEILSQERREIIELLEMFPNGLELSSIAKQLGKDRGKDYSAIRQLIRSMVKDGQLVQDGARGRYKLPTTERRSHQSHQSHCQDFSSDFDPDDVSEASDTSSHQSQQAFNVSDVSDARSDKSHSKVNFEADVSDVSDVSGVRQESYSAFIERLAEVERVGDYQGILNLAWEVHQSQQLTPDEKAKLNTEVAWAKRRMAYPESA